MLMSKMERQFVSYKDAIIWLAEHEEDAKAFISLTECRTVQMVADLYEGDVDTVADDVIDRRAKRKTA